MIDAPPPPELRVEAVAYGSVAARVGRGTERLGIEVDGRVTRTLDVPKGPRSVSIPLPVGDRRIRVRAVGPGGRTWSRAVRTDVLPKSARRAGRVPGFLDARLQGDLGSIVARVPATTGVYAQHLVTGCGAAVNANAQFPAASTLKAAMLVDAVRRGRARELRGDLDRMISVSSDEAANRVIAALGGGSLEAGGASITDTLRDLGLERSLVRRGYVLTDRRPIPIEATNAPALATNFITTPFELGRLMVAIHRGAIPRGGIGRLGIGRKEARREVLGRLLRVLDRTKLAQGVPSDVPLAHKSGFTRHVRHDAGLIYVKSGPIVAVGMSWNNSGVSHTAGTRFLSKVARSAVRRLEGGGACGGIPLRAKR